MQVFCEAPRTGFESGIIFPLKQNGFEIGIEFRFFKLTIETLSRTFSQYINFLYKFDNKLYQPAALLGKQYVL